MTVAEVRDSTTSRRTVHVTSPKRERMASPRGSDHPLPDNAQARQRRAIAILMIVFAFADIAPSLLTLLSAGRNYHVSGARLGTGTLSQTSASSALQTASWVVFIVICAALAFRESEVLAGKLHVGDTRGFLILFGFLATAELAARVGGGQTSTVRSLLIFMIAALALFLNQVSFDSLAIVGRMIAYLAVGTAAFALMSSAAWTVPAAGDSKAVFGTNLLAGPFSQGNSLGIVMAGGLPFVGAAYRGRKRAFLVVLIALLVVLSGSRTSMLAVAVIALVAMSRAVLEPTLSRAVAFLAGISTLVATVVVPAMTKTATSFTGRGGIWQVSEQFWPSFKWFGLGPYAYSDPRFYGASGQVLLHGHNTYVTTRTEIGLVGCMALAVLLISLLFKAASVYGSDPVPMYFMLGILALGLLETPLRLDTVNDQGWVVWGGLIILACAPKASLRGPTGHRAPGATAVVS